MYEVIKFHLNSYPYTDFDPFYSSVYSTISKLINWEIISEIDMQWALKTMTLIVNSRLCNLLVESPYLQKLLIIIDNENFPLEI